MLRVPLGCSSADLASESSRGREALHRAWKRQFPASQGKHCGGGWAGEGRALTVPGVTFIKQMGDFLGP